MANTRPAVAPCAPLPAEASRERRRWQGAEAQRKVSVRRRAAAAFFAGKHPFCAGSEHRTAQVAQGFGAKNSRVRTNATGSCCIGSSSLHFSSSIHFRVEQKHRNSFRPLTPASNASIEEDHFLTCGSSNVTVYSLKFEQYLLGETVTRAASLHDYTNTWRCTRQETKTIENVDASPKRDVAKKGFCKQPTKRRKYQIDACVLGYLEASPLLIPGLR